MKVDGKTVLEVEDEGLTAGTVGLYSKGSELVIFGDVSVNGIEPDVPDEDNDDVPDEDVEPDDDTIDDVPEDVPGGGGGRGQGGVFERGAAGQGGTQLATRVHARACVRT